MTFDVLASSDQPQPWYAVHVRSRYEKLACEILSQKGYETFLPTHPVRRCWSDRHKTLEVPLFPTYLFCQFDSMLRVPILSTSGVRNIIGDAQGPVAVDPAEIQSIKLIVESRVASECLPYLVAGDRVQVERGPLAGLEGTITDLKSRYRLTVSMTLLNRSVAVEIEHGAVRPILAKRVASAEPGSGNSKLLPALPRGKQTDLYGYV